MSTFIGTYDPLAVNIQLGGQEVYGFADGEMVTVEKNADFFNNMVGTKGDVTRAVNRDNTYTITIRLQHTTPFIEIIENYKAVQSVAQIPPVLTFQLDDPSSFDRSFAAQVWLNVDATHDWGDETGVREYQFFAVNGVTGANTSVTALNFAVNAGLI